LPSFSAIVTAAASQAKRNLARGKFSLLIPAALSGNVAAAFIFFPMNDLLSR